MGVLSILFFAIQVGAQTGAVVTQTMRIEIDHRIHTARKINGRWWAEDNRELSQTNVGWLWHIRSGGNAWNLVRFDHHRPVDSSKVNSLDRSMGPDQVRAILGPPNSVFPSDKPASQQHWDYYGPEGYKLSIHFSTYGGIFNATFEPDAKSMPKDVPNLAVRFNGKTTQESFEEHKNRPQRQVPASQEEFRKQLEEEMAKRRSQKNQTSPR
jgi:outer membrane protein assembly factor BamE (lipoprotein component of BamABCDE complex)